MTKKEEKTGKKLCKFRAFYLAESHVPIRKVNSIHQYPFDEISSMRISALPQLSVRKDIILQNAILVSFTFPKKKPNSTSRIF